MTLYAIDDIDDALDATRAFLWPFDLGRWTKLAVVVFFLGGTGAANPLQFTSGTPSEMPTEPSETRSLSELIASISASEWAIIAAVVGVILLIGLVFMFIGSVMEFVFVESLRRERVSIRQYWSERWRQGSRLFGFRLVVSVLSLAVAAALVVVGFGPLLFGNGSLSLAAVLFAVFGFIALAVVGALVNGFTTEFVVPIMLVEEGGLLAAWRRFWPTVTGQWKQYVTYVVVSFVLQIAVGILVSIVTAIAAVVLVIPLVIVGVAGVGLLSVSAIAGWAVIGLAATLLFLALFVLALYVAVPVQTYLRYYALLVLGDTNDAFDLVAERRRAIRG